MIKHCPGCIQIPMLFFDPQGENELYNKQNPNEPIDVVERHQRIDWGRWPWEGPPVPNTWACPRCGHNEPVAEDVLAQQENRPRLFE